MLVVTLSMALTPVVYALATRLSRPPASARPFDTVDDTEHHVVIAGFGRFGQITARILRALKIPFTALEIDPDQVDMSQRFGSKSYYGDASSLDLLQAARVDKARFVVLAIDDPTASIRTAEALRQHFPDLQIFARARNRQHAYRLMDLGISNIERETYHSSLVLTEQLLVGLGLTPRQARRAIVAFRTHDEKLLAASHAIYKDDAQLVQTTREASVELRALFDNDENLQAGKPD
jgi:glutathione-regulated potassium-efflux system ancillary protein KefC/glutathione-regulated potassium-efflux system protein KefB